MTARERTQAKKSQAWAIAVAAALLACAGPASAGEFGGIRTNNDGVSKFKDKRNAESYDKFVEALVDLPFAPQVHLNLGRAFHENKEFEKGIQEYMAAAKLADREPRVRFEAFFNAGTAATELKRIDQALSFYQQALEIDPESKETKHNIELLVAQGQGGGQGDQQEQQDQQQNKDQQKQGQQPKPQPQDQKGEQPQKKGTPRPFNSDQISQQDVNRILEELKRQEEQIRAKFQREGAKDVPKDKDW